MNAPHDPLLAPTALLDFGHPGRAVVSAKHPGARR